MSDTAGTPRARALAAAIRQVLDGSGKSIREVAALLDKSHATLSQWQNGKRVPKIEHVAALLAVVGVTGKRADDILDLTHDAADPNWLTAGVSGISQQLAGTIECERTASEIIEWTPLVPPGMWHTEDYGRAVIGSDDTLSRSEVDGLVAVRLRRRSVVMTEHDDLPPCQYVGLIGEWALRQTIGDVKVWQAQLHDLCSVAELERVTLQVVPIGDGYHSGLAGSFSLYNFRDMPSIVSVERFRGAAFLYDKDDVTAHKVAAASIRRAALSPADSIRFIAAVANEREDRA